MNVNEGKEMLLAVCRHLIEKEQFLCGLDSCVGDGDHGVTVARGFGEAQKALLAGEFKYPAEVFGEVGNVLISAMGGAAGPLLGSFFMAGAKRIGQAEELGTAEFAVLFSEGLKRMQLLGNAEEGDRTMVDALAPACRALQEACVQEETLQQALKAAAKAAQEGAEKTKQMQAKKGRARFLGEKSLGYVDAGATTITLIISQMAAYVSDMCRCAD